MLGLVDRFGLFVSRAFGVTSLADVTPEHVEAFVRSASANGELAERRDDAAPSFDVAAVVSHGTRSGTDRGRSDARSGVAVADQRGGAAVDGSGGAAVPTRRARGSDEHAVSRCRGRWEKPRRAPPRSPTFASPISICAALGSGFTARATPSRVGDRSRRGVSGNSSDTSASTHRPTPTASLTYRGSANPESRRAHSSQAIRETLRRAGLTVDSVRAAGVAGRVGRPPGVVRDGSDRRRRRGRWGCAVSTARQRLIGWDWTTDDGRPDG